AKLDHLARHPLLAKCSPAELRRLSAHFDEVRLRAGDVLLEPAPLARWFFIIDTGTAEVTGGDGPVATLGQGDSCGHAALRLRDPQTTTVRALTDMTAYAAPGRDILGLVGQMPLLRAGPIGAFLPPPAPLVPRALPHSHPRPRPRARAQPFRTDFSVPATDKSARNAGGRVVPPRHRVRSSLIAVAVIATALLGAARYHPGVLLLSPGPVIDITDDVEITGAPVYRPAGRYMLTSVRASRPSLLAVGLRGFRGQVEVVPLHGSTSERDKVHRQAEADFAASRRAAVTAASRSAGVPAPTVHFRHRDIVGPSGGLVYALLIADLLTPGDLTGGRAIAATGTLDPAGAVGRVGGIAEKAAALRRVGGTLLLLPIDQLAGDYGVTVVGVASLNEALGALRS
ncbi:MAG: cyclic nucleotide-binding domain-containing protein, partial [Actinobacteria bacterium]|nr:cyclic nucleotide-binding domain-containing protein [Actinomycetota bacterium]